MVAYTCQTAGLTHGQRQVFDRWLHTGSTDDPATDTNSDDGDDGDGGVVVTSMSATMQREMAGMERIVPG